MTEIYSEEITSQPSFRCTGVQLDDKRVQSKTSCTISNIRKQLMRKIIRKFSRLSKQDHKDNPGKDTLL